MNKGANINKSIQKKYQTVTQEMRKEVLRRLLVEKESLTKVARDLNLKYCTCRTIKKTYQIQGRIGKKNTRRRKIRVVNRLEISIINPLNGSSAHEIVYEKEKNLFVEKNEKKLSELSSDYSKQLLTEQLIGVIGVLNQFSPQSRDIKKLLKSLCLGIEQIGKQLEIKIDMVKEETPPSSEQQTYCQPQDAINILKQIQQQGLLSLVQTQIQNNLLQSQLKLLIQMQSNQSIQQFPRSQQRMMGVNQLNQQ